jgi:hypothetical protein
LARAPTPGLLGPPFADADFIGFEMRRPRRYAAPANRQNACGASLLQNEAKPEMKPGKKEETLAQQVWVAGLIGIVIILLIVFSIVL